MSKNRDVRFGFGGLTVLVAWCGHQVSFNTTVGGDVLLKDILSTHRYVLNASLS